MHDLLLYIIYACMLGILFGMRCILRCYMTHTYIFFKYMCRNLYKFYLYIRYDIMRLFFKKKIYKYIKLHFFNK